MNLKATEADLQAAAMDLMAGLGFPPIRINSGGIRTPEGRYVRLAPAGTSDILSIVPVSGRFLAVEIKRPGNEPTEAQREFLRTIRRLGGVAVWIDDLKELERLLKELLDDPDLTVRQGEP